MNISLMNNDAVSGIVKMVVGKEDYANEVDKQLRKYRQSANIPGFRKGMAPLGMIRKMYGKYLIAEEVNKCVSENLIKYIRENDIRIIGDPLPNETEQKTIDFDVQETFEFFFDIALSPQIDVKLNKRDKLIYHKIIIDDAMVERQIDSYRKNYGSYDPADEIEEADLVKGVLAELNDDKTPKEGGILVIDAVLMVKYFKGKKEQSKFLGAKLNDVVIFNPGKAYKGAAAEIASLLKIDKDRAADVKSDFRFEVKEITRHREAGIDQDLFDKIFGPGAVTSEAEFNEKVKQSLDEQMKPDSDYLFRKDMRALFIRKAGDVAFADDILKRWLLAVNKENTPEKVEEDYPKAVEELKYHLVQDQIIRDNDLQTGQADVENIARQVARAQFAQYGMLSVPDDVLDNYTKDMLKRKETLENIAERAKQDKVVAWVKEHVKVETDEISYEDFAKISA